MRWNKKSNRKMFQQKSTSFVLKCIPCFTAVGTFSKMTFYFQLHSLIHISIYRLMIALKLFSTRILFHIVCRRARSLTHSYKSQITHMCAQIQFALVFLMDLYVCAPFFCCLQPQRSWPFHINKHTFMVLKAQTFSHLPSVFSFVILTAVCNKVFSVTLNVFSTRFSILSQLTQFAQRQQEQ